MIPEDAISGELVVVAGGLYSDPVELFVRAKIYCVNINPSTIIVNRGEMRLILQLLDLVIRSISLL